MSTQNRLFTVMTPSLCSLTDTKQSLQYTIKTHLSGPPMLKFEVNMNHTAKPAQLHGTVHQKCHCKISYGTTFDSYDPEAISQWCDTYIQKNLFSNLDFYIRKAGSGYFDSEKNESYRAFSKEKIHFS